MCRKKGNVFQRKYFEISVFEISRVDCIGTDWIEPGQEVIKLFTCSTHLSMKS